MTTTVHAFVSDLTPNRATVEAVGDADDLASRFEDRCDGRIIEVPADTEAGERVWLPPLSETESETIARINAESAENTRMFLAGEIRGPYSNLSD